MAPLSMASRTPMFVGWTQFDTHPPFEGFMKMLGTAFQWWPAFLYLGLLGTFHITPSEDKINELKRIDQGRCGQKLFRARTRLASVLSLLADRSTVPVYSSSIHVHVPRRMRGLSPRSSSRSAALEYRVYRHPPQIGKLGEDAGHECKFGK
jgi:hypothetical protein